MEVLWRKAKWGRGGWKGYTPCFLAVFMGDGRLAKRRFLYEWPGRYAGHRQSGQPERQFMSVANGAQSYLMLLLCGGFSSGDAWATVLY